MPAVYFYRAFPFIITRFPDAMDAVNHTLQAKSTCSRMRTTRRMLPPSKLVAQLKTKSRLMLANHLTMNVKYFEQFLKTATFPVFTSLITILGLEAPIWLWISLARISTLCEASLNLFSSNMRSMSQSRFVLQSRVMRSLPTSMSPLC